MLASRPSGGSVLPPLQQVRDVLFRTVPGARVAIDRLTGRPMHPL